MAKHTVLVTGGSGFLGTFLCGALAGRGDNVINFDLHPRRGVLGWVAREWEHNTEWEKGDVANLTQLLAVVKKHRPDRIAHLAASIDMASLDSNPIQAYQQMVGGVVNVLETMRLLAGVERMVNFSSIGVLSSRCYEPIDCDHPTLRASEGPSGIYGAGKVAGEAFCWAYADLFDLDVVQLRPSAAYGIGTTNTIFMNQMLEGALRGEPVHLPYGGSLARDYTHVEDITGIALAALDAPPQKLKHRVFFAASGMNPLVSGSEIARIVCEMVPGADVSIGAALTPAIERHDLKFRGVHDVRPVREQLGYTIRFGDIREGMKEYADRYCEYLAANGISSAKRAS